MKGADSSREKGRGEGWKEFSLIEGLRKNTQS